MIKNLSLLFFALLLTSTLCLAQHKGKLRVFTDPAEAIIKIGDIKLEYGKFIELDTGTYIIQAWAPNRKLVSKKIRLDSSDLKTVPIKIPYSDAYKKYRFHKKSYTFYKNFLRYSIPISYAVYSLNVYTNLNKAKDDAKRFESAAFQAKANYDQSIWINEITLYKSQYNQHKLNYDDAIAQVNKSNTLLLVGTGSAIVMTYLGWKLSNKLNKPHYSEKPLLSDISVAPLLSPYGSGVSLTLKLN